MVKPERDRAALARILDRDRAWALYALADLDDGLFEQCEWWVSGDGLALVFHGLAIRPLFVMGPTADVRTLLQEIPVASGYLNLRAEHADASDGVFQFASRHGMCRMLLERFVGVPGETTPLSSPDLPEIEALYASGSGGGIAFAPAQLETGVFRGVRRDGVLVAVAGAQVLSVERSVAAVGNVFVRPEWRGRGLAQCTLSATVAATLDRGVQTIGLNVERNNTAAVTAYERLGFRPVLQYVEGPAARVI